jgi:multiple sugar transport system permease protein
VRRAALLGAATLVVATALAPVWLLFKQAFTPERESFAWPPTWWPADPTGENFRAAAAAVDLGPGVVLSAGVALGTTLAAVVLALPAAWLAARRPSVERPLAAVTVLVRVFPSIALGVPLAALFVGAGLYNHPTGAGLWLAHTLLALPVAFLVLRAGFAGVPRDIEEAALLDGATPRRAFVAVIVPLVRPALGAAALLVFLLSWDEFAYALLLQVTHRSLPPLLYYLGAFGYPGMASAVAVILLVPALAFVLVLEPALRSGVLAGSGK